MVAHHHQGQGGPQFHGVDASQQLPEGGVLKSELLSHGGVRRPGAVGDGINARPVAHDEPRALPLRQPQPAEHLLDLFRFGALRVEGRHAVAGADAVPVGLRADPEVCGGGQPLALRRRPEGFGLDPGGVIFVAVNAALGILEVVVDHAVDIGPGAGGDGDVAREGVGRIDRDQALCPCPFALHALQGWKRRAVEQVVAHAVHGDQHHGPAAGGFCRSDGEGAQQGEQHLNEPLGTAMGGGFHVRSLP